MEEYARYFKILNAPDLLEIKLRSRVPLESPAITDRVCSAQ